MGTWHASVRTSTRVALCAFAVMLSGCGNPDSYPNRLREQIWRPLMGTAPKDVGQTHVAVLSVTRWDDYRRHLQPTFELTEDKALKSAMADTLQTDQSILDAFAARLGLQLAPSGVLPAGYKDKGYAGEGIPEPNAAGAPATPAARAEPNGLGVDPHLAYLAATALYQEVKLLNRYIADAAIPKDYRAYVVRTQIACMPCRRGLSYDTYVDLSFDVSYDRNILDDKLPRVIPLLVTDQVEAALLSRRAETLRQVALALSAAYAGIGGKVDVERLTNAIESSLGRNYNSLLTVGRLSNNTLRVRLGARQSPGKNSYEMVAQTHNVSLLLLLPKEWVDENKKEKKERSLWLASRTRFAYCVNGKYVPVPDVAWDRSLIEELSHKWIAPQHEQDRRALERPRKALVKALSRPGVWDNLLQYSAQADYQSFSRELKAQMPRELNTQDKCDPNLIMVMWRDINAWGSGRYQKAEFPVPMYPAPKLVGGRDRTAVLVDDGKTTSATIIGVEGIDPEKVSAVWRFQCQGKMKWAWWEFLWAYPLQRSFMQQYAFAATSASLAPGDRNLILTFPSLAALDLTPEAAVAKGTDGLCLDCRSRDGDSSHIGPLSCVYQRAKQKARVTVQVVQEQLWASVDNKGVQQPRSLLVGFVRSEGVGKKDDIAGYKMAVSGAVVQGLLPPADSVITPAPEEGIQVYTIRKDGQVTLQLTELVAGQTLKLTFGAPTGYENPPAKEIKIVAAPTTREVHRWEP